MSLKKSLQKAHNHISKGVERLREVQDEVGDKGHSLEEPIKELRRINSTLLLIAQSEDVKLKRKS